MSDNKQKKSSRQAKKSPKQTHSKARLSVVSVGKDKGTQPDKPTEDRSSWGSFGGGTSQVNGFTVGPDGFNICKKRNTKGGPKISVDKVGTAGLRIVRCLKKPSSAASHKYWPTIEFRTAGGGIELLSVPFAALGHLENGRGEAAAIAAAGFPIPPTRGGGAAALASCAQRMYWELLEAEKFEIVQGVGRPGWHNGQHVLPGHKDYAGDDPVMVGTAGEEGPWRELMVDLFNKNPMLPVTAAWAFSGFLKNKIFPPFHISPILNQHGQAGAGKTFMSTVICAWVADPGAQPMIAAGNSTKPAIEALLQAGSFTYLDDFGVTMETRFRGVADVMEMCSNATRAKMGRGVGGMSKRAKKWDCMILADSNGPLVDTLSPESASYIAAVSRIVDVDIDRFGLWSGEKFRSDGQRYREINAIILNHYGHGYQLIIDHILKDEEKLKAYFEKKQAAVVEQFLPEAGGPGVDFAGDPISFSEAVREQIDRPILYYAMCRTTLKVIAGVLGKQYDPGPAQDLLKQVFDDQLRKYEVEHTHAEMVGALLSWFNKHRRKFRFKRHLHRNWIEGGSNNQQANVTEWNSGLSGIIGEFRQTQPMANADDLRGELYISKEGVKLAQKDGLNLNMITDQAVKEGWAVTKSDKKGGPPRPKPNTGRLLGRCHGYIIGDESPSTDQAETCAAAVDQPQAPPPPTKTPEDDMDGNIPEQEKLPTESAWDEKKRRFDRIMAFDPGSGPPSDGDKAAEYWFLLESQAALRRVNMVFDAVGTSYRVFDIPVFRKCIDKYKQPPARVKKALEEYSLGVAGEAHRFAEYVDRVEIMANR